MEIGKQRQVCQGFRLNQDSNPHDLLLDDPWDLTVTTQTDLVATQTYPVVAGRELSQLQLRGRMYSLYKMVCTKVR